MGSGLEIQKLPSSADTCWQSFLILGFLSHSGALSDHAPWIRARARARARVRVRVRVRVGASGRIRVGARVGAKKHACCVHAHVTCACIW